jgi:hypothetical protein
VATALRASLRGVALLAPLVAVAGGLYSVFKAAKTSALLDQVHEKITRVTEQLSTRYLGEFPGFLAEVTKLLATAEQQIVIACDEPAYGFLANAELHARYEKILQEKSRAGVIVDLVVLDEGQRHQAREKYFRKLKIKDFKKTAGYKALLKVADPKALKDPKDIQKLVEERQKRALAGLEHVNRYQYPGRMTSFFWLVDDKAAVFSLPNLAGPGKEGAFATEQRGIVRQLQETFESYKATASLQPAVPPPPSED